MENLDHSRTRAKSPQSDGICQRFHRTIQEEFYSVAFRKKLYRSLEQLQLDLNAIPANTVSAKRLGHVPGFGASGAGENDGPSDSHWPVGHWSPGRGAGDRAKPCGA